MNSRKSLSGDELFKLYLEDKKNDHFKSPENLKSLLNYALNNMKDTIDSNLEMEIIDFCVENLQKETSMEENKAKYFGEKYTLIAKQKQKQLHLHSVRKIAAAAAVFVVVGGAVFFGTDNVGKAGVFDWVDRLIVEDKGEQLSLSTPNMELSKIEMKEGHLPEQLPDEFIFTDSYLASSSITQKYIYEFRTTNDIFVTIHVIEYADTTILANNELEINNNSYKTESKDNFKYYYCKNNDIYSISWLYDNNIYILESTDSIEILEKIISFYKMEQN